MTQLAALLVLRSALVATSGLQEGLVLRSYQDLTRPAASHLVIQPVSSRGYGRPYRDGEDWAQHRRLALQVTAVGAATVATLADAQLLLETTSPLVDVLRTSGVGIASMGGIRDLTRGDGASWEPRASFDLALSYVHRVTAAGAAPADRVLVDLTTAGALEAGPTTIYDEPLTPDTTAADIAAFVHLLLPPPHSIY